MDLIVRKIMGLSATYPRNVRDKKPFKINNVRMSATFYIL